VLLGFQGALRAIINRIMKHELSAQQSYLVFMVPRYSTPTTQYTFGKI
jgi:hypothetical protein